jgi:putative transposase
MVTCATHLKRPYFAGANRLHLLRETLLNLAQEYGWNLQAWAIFPNHYHFVALSPVKSESLQPFVQKLHANTALSANEWDEAPGRQVWYQYWETHLTFQKSYYARLCYVHRNAVHHNLVQEPSLYQWCSAGWFQQKSTTAFYRTIMKFGIDRLQVPDDFEVEWSPEPEVEWSPEAKVVQSPEAK